MRKIFVAIAVLGIAIPLNVSAFTGEKLVGPYETDHATTSAETQAALICRTGDELHAALHTDEGGDYSSCRNVAGIVASCPADGEVISPAYDWMMPRYVVHVNGERFVAVEGAASWISTDPAVVLEPCGAESKMIPVRLPRPRPEQ